MGEHSASWRGGPLWRAVVPARSTDYPSIISIQRLWLSSRHYCRLYPAVQLQFTMQPTQSHSSPVSHIKVYPLPSSPRQMLIEADLFKACWRARRSNGYGRRFGLRLQAHFDRMVCCWGVSSSGDLLLNLCCTDR